MWKWGGYFFFLLLSSNVSLIMFVIRLSSVNTSITLIQLTSISGGRFEPPTVFCSTPCVYYSILVEFCQIYVSRLTNRARRGIIKITKRRTAVSGSPPKVVLFQVAALCQSGAATFFFYRKYQEQA